MKDFNSVSRILTLRYDPAKKPVRRPLTLRDFIPRQVNDSEHKIIEIIGKDLYDSAQSLKLKRISLSLSGGIDSGLTVAMIRSFLPSVKLDCISIGFGSRDDEIEQAREIARANDCNFQTLIIEDVLRDLPKLINIVKEPRWNLYHYYAFEAGRKKSSVFYTGDGGDELFGGYVFRYSKFLTLLSNSKTSWEERVKLYLSCHERDWVPDQDHMFGTAVKFSWENIYTLLQTYFDNDLHPLDQIFLADFNGKLLYDWLPSNKAFEKSLDMKIKSIFLTDRMIRFATHIPWQLKFNPEKGIGKLPLRSILAKQKGFGKTEPVKKGFSADIVSLWKRNAGEIVRTYVNSDSEVVKEKIINLEWLTKTHKLLSAETELNPRYINKMFSILALEIWHRLFISHTMSSKRKL